MQHFCAHPTLAPNKQDNAAPRLAATDEKTSRRWLVSRQERVHHLPHKEPPMWIPKWQRDLNEGVDSPVPTQVVSNEEFIPRPQNKQQKQVETLIGQLAAERAKKLGLDRRAFLTTSMGMATAFLAMNRVYGSHWDVDEAETLDEAVGAEKWPKGEYFIMDVQTHFTNGARLAFRNAEFIKNMGFELKNDADAYAFPNMVKEMFF